MKLRAVGQSTAGVLKLVVCVEVDTCPCAWFGVVPVNAA
jgi:hypothetical protein